MTAKSDHDRLERNCTEPLSTHTFEPVIIVNNLWQSRVCFLQGRHTRFFC